LRRKVEDKTERVLTTIEFVQMESFTGNASVSVDILNNNLKTVNIKAN
jgi:hypothetical protein